MPKPGAFSVHLSLHLAFALFGLTVHATAMECSNLLEKATDINPPLRIADSDERSAWSMKAAPFISEGAKSVVDFPGIPDQFLLMSKSVDLCKAEGCMGQIYSLSQGVSYYIPEFLVTTNAVIFSWRGFYETTTLLQFSDVTRDDAKRQVGSYIAFDEFDFQTLYADSVKIQKPGEWTDFGGQGYGAIPAKLFSYAPRATNPECEK